MIAFFRPTPLFGATERLQTTNTNILSRRNRANDHHSHAVVVFSHYRDVKVALDDLDGAGFSGMGGAVGRIGARA